MRALVTGGHGFVGSHLRHHLESMGDQVTSLDRRGPDAVDVRDRDRLVERVHDEKPDVLYHLAAFTHVGPWLRPEYYPGASREEAILGEARAVRQGVGLVDIGTLGKFEVSGPECRSRHRARLSGVDSSHRPAVRGVSHIAVTTGCVAATDSMVSIAAPST